MSDTAIDRRVVDPQLLANARAVTGLTDSAVISLDLRRLVAPYRKRAMIDGIVELKDLPEGLGAPTIEYPVDEA